MMTNSLMTNVGWPPLTNFKIHRIISVTRNTPRQGVVRKIITYKASGCGINAQPLEKLIIWGRAVTSDLAHFAQLDKSAFIRVFLAT